MNHYLKRSSEAQAINGDIYIQIYLGMVNPTCLQHLSQTFKGVLIMGMVILDPKASNSGSFAAIICNQPNDQHGGQLSFLTGCDIMS